MIRGVWARLRARRIERRARCPWCQEYLLPDQPTARTGEGRLVHQWCEPDATDDEHQAAAW